MSDGPEARREEWLASLVDPAREEALAAGDDLPDRVAAFAEPVQGEPAFDPAFIESIGARLDLPEEGEFERPLLARAVRVGLAHIDATFQGNHPKYGVGTYAQDCHDSFPPTIIAAVDALTLWGMTGRAEELFGYWLAHFVREDGSINYYGPSVSEYGMLLTTGRRLMDRGGSAGWLAAHGDGLRRLERRLRDWMREGGAIGLLRGVPEADEAERPARYFHSSAWVVRGLSDWASVLEGHLDDGNAARQAREDAQALRGVLIEALEACWPHDPQDWWLRPTVEEEGYLAPPQGYITQSRLGSYTNYRYWPELLSSGVLPREWMERIVASRQTAGGQFCGVTRFERQLDDWPLMEHLEGLWALGRYDDYRLSLWGHIRYHQAEGHLTAYEQVSFPPGRKAADYCLPCQLVAVRAEGKRRNGER